MRYTIFPLPWLTRGQGGVQRAHGADSKYESSTVRWAFCTRDILLGPAATSPGNCMTLSGKEQQDSCTCTQEKEKRGKDALQEKLHY